MEESCNNNGDGGGFDDGVNGGFDDGVNGGLMEYPSMMMVMTEEQIEILRHQIVAYTIISEQLREMYKSFISQQQGFFGKRHEDLYCVPLMESEAHKIGWTQRWAPTPAQFQILENLFLQDGRTPSKQKIQEITIALAQHGQITESNVQNWFQNRKAKSKKKKKRSATVSEADADITKKKKKQKKKTANSSAQS